MLIHGGGNEQQDALSQRQIIIHAQLGDIACHFSVTLCDIYQWHCVTYSWWYWKKKKRRLYVRDRSTKGDNDGWVSRVTQKMIKDVICQEQSSWKDVEKCNCLCHSAWHIMMKKKTANQCIVSIILRYFKLLGARFLAGGIKYYNVKTQLCLISCEIAFLWE